MRVCHFILTFAAAISLVGVVRGLPVTGYQRHAFRRAKERWKDDDVIMHRRLPTALVSFIKDVFDKEDRMTKTSAFKAIENLQALLVSEEKAGQGIGDDIALGALFVLWQLDRFSTQSQDEGGADGCRSNPMWCIVVAYEIAFEHSPSRHKEHYIDDNAWIKCAVLDMRPKIIGRVDLKTKILDALGDNARLVEDSKGGQRWLDFKKQARSAILDIKRSADIKKECTVKLRSITVSPAAVAVVNLRQPVHRESVHLDASPLTPAGIGSVTPSVPAATPGSAATLSVDQLVSAQLSFFHVALLENHPAAHADGQLADTASKLGQLLGSKSEHQHQHLASDTLIGSLFVLWQLAMRIRDPASLKDKRIRPANICHKNPRVCLLVSTQIAWDKVHVGPTASLIHPIEWHAILGFHFDGEHNVVAAARDEMVKAIEMGDDGGFLHHDGNWWNDFRESVTTIVLDHPENNAKEDLGHRILAITDPWVVGYENVAGERKVTVRPPLPSGEKRKYFDQWPEDEQSKRLRSEKFSVDSFITRSD